MMPRIIVYMRRPAVYAISSPYWWGSGQENVQSGWKGVSKAR
jgi:hypothetical protein